MKVNSIYNLVACLALGSLGSFLSFSAYASGKQSLEMDAKKGVQRRGPGVPRASHQTLERSAGLALPTFDPTSLVEEYINSPATEQRLVDALASIAAQHGLDAEKSALLEEFARQVAATMRTSMSSSLPENGPLQLPSKPIPADKHFKSALGANPLLMRYAEKLPRTFEDYLHSRILQLRFMSERLEDFYFSSYQGLFGNDLLSQVSLKAAVASMKMFVDVIVSTTDLQSRRYRNTPSDYTYILSVAGEFKALMGLVKSVQTFLNDEDIFVRRMVMTEISSMLDFSSLLMPLIDVIFSDKNISDQFKLDEPDGFSDLEKQLKYYHSLRQRLGGVHAEFGKEILTLQSRQEEQRRIEADRRREIDKSFLPDHLKQPTQSKAASQPGKKKGGKKKNRNKKRKGQAVASSIPTIQSSVIGVAQESIEAEIPLASQPVIEMPAVALEKEKEAEPTSLVAEINTPVVEIVPETVETEEERNYLQEWAFQAVQENPLQPNPNAGIPFKKDTSPPLSSTLLSTGTNATTSIHTPHVSRGNSRGSQNLRPYHVENLKAMFSNGGYNLETVTENRKIGKVPQPGRFFLAGGFKIFKEIMQGTYNGKMDSVVSLVVEHFGGKAYRSSHNTWHFKINSLGTQRQIFWNIDMPQPNNSELE